MERFGKKKLALLLAVSLLLGLAAGCGKKGDNQQLSATVYVPKYLDLAVDVDYIRGGCVSGDDIYFVGQKSREKERTDEEGMHYSYWEEVYDLYRVPLTGGSAEKLPNYVGPSVPEGREGYAYVNNIRPGADGTVWVEEYSNIYSYSDMKYPAAVEAAAGVVYARDTLVEPAEEEIDEVDDEDVADDGIAVDDVAIDEVPDDDYYDGDYYYNDSQETRLRRRLDQDGNELERIDLSSLNDALTQIVGEDVYFNTTVFDNEGNLYAVTGDKIYVLDPGMELLYTLEGENMWNDLILLGDGTLGMIQWVYDEETDTGSSVLRTIDPEKQDWGTVYPMASNIYNIQPGGGDYLFYYQVNDAIFGFKAGEPDADGNGTGEGERLFSWVEADINSDNLRNFFFLPDGRVAAILQDWVEEGDSGHYVADLALLTATPRDQLPEKTTLVYATLNLNYEARRRIIDFNKRSETCRIEVRDYAEYDTDYTGAASLQKLNTEILAGNVPDILDTQGLPVRTYGGKDILEDLWPFIDNDPELGRDALMLRPLEADQQDGKLYEIFSNFSINTVAGPANIVGDRMSWTLADLTAALQKMPEGCSIFGVSDTKMNMLSTVLALNMDQFVDWGTGKCSFDSDDFKSLLAFCNSFPAEFDWEKVDWDEWEEQEARLLTGKQMLMNGTIYGFDWYLREAKSLFPEGYAFVGYPKEDGGCGSCFSLRRGVAMTSACRDKDAAWSFLRETLLPQMKESDRWYYYGNFPINRADFERMTEMVLKNEYVLDENGEILLDENGEPTFQDQGSWWISDDLQLPMQNLVREDVDKVMALYDTIDSVYRYDDNIYNAVQEVASQYFAGDKPLEETATLIQSKVSLYVNETL